MGDWIQRMKPEDRREEARILKEHLDKVFEFCRDCVPDQGVCNEHIKLSDAYNAANSRISDLEATIISLREDACRAEKERDAALRSETRRK